MPLFSNYPPVALPGRFNFQGGILLNAIAVEQTQAIVAAGTTVILTGVEFHLRDALVAAAGVDSNLRVRIMDAPNTNFLVIGHYAQLAGSKVFATGTLLTVTDLNLKANGLLFSSFLTIGAGWTNGNISCNVFWRLPFPNE